MELISCSNSSFVHTNWTQQSNLKVYAWMISKILHVLLHIYLACVTWLLFNTVQHM